MSAQFILDQAKLRSVVCGVKQLHENNYLNISDPNNTFFTFDNNQDAILFLDEDEEEEVTAVQENTKRKKDKNKDEADAKKPKLGGKVTLKSTHS